ncbi:hypothetical protein DDE82_005766 [Stemphylium lycopersici]|nr:hypothetical protein TW65_08400 [Stemphylium lycopersici]RAR02524.1 hypothetical protein DDE82_005766 [Stemphylium lycopersici]
MASHARGLITLLLWPWFPYVLTGVAASDAAAKHGHEYSPPRAASPSTNASFFQMPLSILGSVLRGQTPSPSQATVPSSDHADPTHDAALGASTPPRDAMKKTHDEAVIPFLPSRPASSGSDGTAEKLKKRSRRSKTSFNIARPVNTRSKLHTRPKVHLQLHQVIASQRPKPAYEVVPYSHIPQRSARRLSNTFNTRERLGQHDLLVVKAGPYTTQDEEQASDEDRWGARDVIGVLSTRRCEKGVTEATDICINDGMSRWSVADMPNGGYEFNTTDAHGLTLKARWVLKPAHARRSSSMSMAAPLSPTPAQATDDKKFTFSTISTDSRRHPIIATMTRSRIDVMDTYSMPSATSTATPSVPSYTQSPTTPPSIDSESFADALVEKLPIETDEALRKFILVSGVWVAAREFASDSSNHATIPALTPSATFRPSTHRTCSMSMLECPRSPSPASTLDENRRSFPRMFKPSLERLPRRSTDTTPPSPASTKTAVKPSPVIQTRSRRAHSTGTAIHSITGSMRKKYGLAFEDQTLVESAEERQMKRSVELLRIKELALPSPIERPSAETPRPMPASIPSPIVIPPSSEGSTAPTSPTPLLASPVLSPPAQKSERSRKTQSAFAPITTTGMWDSGVTEGHGLKKRPTSMFVMNEKKRKQEKKGERSKSKDRKTKQGDESSNEGLGLKRKGDWYMYKIKLRLKDMFKKDRA